MYKFTYDWFSWAPPVWKEIVIPNLPDNKKFLEIGTFEGRSTMWIVENMLADNGTLFTMDDWGEQAAHVQAEEYFDHNVLEVHKKFPLRNIEKIKSKSYPGIAKLIVDNNTDFDFIYLDAFHIGKYLMTDACMLWPLLKTNGIFVFDDYAWDDPRIPGIRPQVAIDDFYNLFNEEIETLHVEYQVVLKKIEFTQEIGEIPKL